jgi:hypothetical protein
MHKPIHTHLESVETSGPDKTAGGSIAFRFSERVVDRTIRDFVIPLDVLGRYGIDLTAGRNSDSGGDESLHLSDAGSICEQSLPQFACACTER